MPASQVPHKQPTSIKNYNDNDDPSNSSCILSLVGTSSFLLHSNRPINAAVPNHDDDNAVIVTVPALSLNIMMLMLSTQSPNLNTTLIICNHDMDYDYHYD